MKTNFQCLCFSYFVFFLVFSCCESHRSMSCASTESPHKPQTEHDRKHSQSPRDWESERQHFLRDRPRGHCNVVVTLFTGVHTNSFSDMDAVMWMHSDALLWPGLRDSGVPHVFFLLCKHVLLHVAYSWTTGTGNRYALRPVSSLKHDCPCMLVKKVCMLFVCPNHVCAQLCMLTFACLTFYTCVRVHVYMCAFLCICTHKFSMCPHTTFTFTNQHSTTPHGFTAWVCLSV